MKQFRLFPPLGVPKHPLPNDALSAVRDLLAELLSQVIETKKEEQPSGEENADE